jgi:hypothetical protein
VLSWMEDARSSATKKRSLSDSACSAAICAAEEARLRTQHGSNELSSGGGLNG